MLGAATFASSCVGGCSATAVARLSRTQVKSCCFAAAGVWLDLLVLPVVLLHAMPVVLLHATCIAPLPPRIHPYCLMQHAFVLLPLRHLLVPTADCKCSGWPSLQVCGFIDIRDLLSSFLHGKGRPQLTRGCLALPVVMPFNSIRQRTSCPPACTARALGLCVDVAVVSVPHSCSRRCGEVKPPPVPADAWPQLRSLAHSWPCDHTAVHTLLACRGGPQGAGAPQPCAC